MLEKEMLLDQARIIISRLERIPVDSIWARRSSGCRGALLKWVERIDQRQTSAQHEQNPADTVVLKELIKTGYEFLEKAARERFR